MDATDAIGRQPDTSARGTTATVDDATCRIREMRWKRGMPKGYRQSLELVDDRTGQAMATCDVIGQPALSTLHIADPGQRTWTFAPNRKVMPSRWTMSDPDGGTVVQVDQKIMAKLANPLYRVAFVILDPDGRETHRVIDPRKNVPDRIFGLGPDEWAIISGELLAARIVWLPKSGPRKPGPLGTLRAMLTMPDRGIVTEGSEHLFPAPVALGLLILHKALTDTTLG